MGNCPIFSLCRNFSSPPAAGALLDRIVSQSEKTDREVPLYALADYRKGGSLVEAYRRGGSKEVERVAIEELKPFLYHDGLGKVMPNDAYAQWKRRNNNNHEVYIEIENNHTKKESPKDETFPMNNKAPEEKERKICWKLEYRGLLGETVLHVLILCNTPVHTRIARTLLKVYPNLACDIIEGDEYFGASALHLAIAYHSSDLVTKLVDCGCNVTQRAKGRFFLPFDQQLAIPKKISDFEGLCYLGEYPLAWAACCEDETSYNLLLSKGADPNMRDTFGNMILHMVVIQDKLTMYGYALRHPTNPARDGILNRFGLTPLTLACKLGRNKIFREMLELSALEFWRYSNITCSGYPLNALDTILPSGRTNWNSALMIILNGTTDEHLDMLDGGVIQRLLEEKWKTFARGQFLKRLALMFLHLLVLSIAVFLRPNDEEPLFKTLDETEAKDICRYCAEIGTCLGCVGFVFFQQVEEIMAQGLLGFLLNLSSNPTKAIFLVSNVMVLMCIPCRVAGHRYMEDLLLSIALPGSWFFLIFFAGAVRLTGPFVTMIYNMLVGDMFRFSIIYFIFLLAFTQAFYFLKKVPTEENTKSFSGYLETWMYLFHMTLGEYEYKELGDNYYRGLTQVVFALFMILTPILLLNMLIAMMGNTYCVVITQSEREWMRQWAKIVVALERAVSQKLARDFMHIYSIKLPSSAGDADDPEKEIRAVMVIKSKNKTKARQRKGALMNWKRLGKKIITELRQNGGSADVLRQKLFSNQLVAAKTTRRRPDNADDFECHESPGGPPKADGLGKALNQLAFAHDWDLSALNAGGEIPEEEEEVKTPKANFGDVFEKITWLNDLDVLNQEGRPNGVGSPPISDCNVQTGTVPQQNPQTAPSTSLPPSSVTGIPNGVISNSLQTTTNNPDINTSLISQVSVATPNGQLPNQEQSRVNPTPTVWPPCTAEEYRTKAWYVDAYETPPPAYETPSNSIDEPDGTSDSQNPTSASSRCRLNATSNLPVENSKEEKKSKKKKKKCKKLKKSKVGVEMTPEERDPDIFGTEASASYRFPEEEAETSPPSKNKSRKKSGKRKKMKHLNLEEVGLHQIDECSEEDGATRSAAGVDNRAFVETPVNERWPSNQQEALDQLFNMETEQLQPLSVSRVGPRKVQAMSSLVAWDEPPDH